MIQFIYLVPIFFLRLIDWQNSCKFANSSWVQTLHWLYSKKLYKSIE